MPENSSASPSCIVNIRCLVPSTSSVPTSSLLTINQQPSLMSTTANNLSSSSFGFISASSQATCNICERLLYSFEEILICRVCHSSSHWRCVKPETISYYGEHDNFICDTCTGHITINGSAQRRDSRVKSPDSLETSYRHFVHVTPKTNGTSANDAIRYSEGKQQAHSSTATYRRTDYDDYLLSTNRGQSTDDSYTTRQAQQQSSHSNGINSDDERESSNMFQANYQYTPLKEYAAMRTITTVTSPTNGTVETPVSNGYRNSQLNGHHRANPSSRYGGGLHYNNHGYDPNSSRIIESPPGNSSTFSSPTVDNLSLHNRRTQYVSSTNLNVNDKPAHHSQISLIETTHTLGRSTPYVAATRESDASVLKGSLQQFSDQNSAVGSDSGIVMIHATQTNPTEENHIVEKKLTDLVQQLGKQLETDAQKINEKLESKLKNLEEMIHQQTYVIRRQDEVIERLKSKISKIEGERDHFREQLTHHQQKIKNQSSIPPNQEQKSKQPSVDTTRDRSRTITPDYSTKESPKSSKQSHSSSNVNDAGRPSTKKNTAPRIEPSVRPPSPHKSHDEPPSTISQIIRSNPLNRNRFESDSPVSTSGSSTASPSVIKKLVTDNPLVRGSLTTTPPVSLPSVTSQIVHATPIIEVPAATNRLNTIIHQDETKPSPHFPRKISSTIAENRTNERKFSEDPITSSHEIEVTNTSHYDDNQKTRTRSMTRSRSSSSSSQSSRLSISPSDGKSPSAINITTTNLPSSTNPRQRNVHGSFESLPPNYGRQEGLKPNNKTASLDFGMKPVQYDDAASSIYITPIEASLPALDQSHAILKGWLRKQNRESIFKRIERYYCVLTNGTLLMHRRDNDRKPQKAINLRGAKVLSYDDPKHGPSLELTWSKPSKITKHYHLYALNAQEARKWAEGIQKAIDNVEIKISAAATTAENTWQRYRLNK